MRRCRAGRIVGWAALLCTTLLLALYVLSLPFCAGASLGSRHTWRFEHGRLTWERHEPRLPKSFWVSHNTEGLRLAWQAQRTSAPGAGWSWRVAIPLWAPLLMTAGLAAAGLRPRPRRLRAAGQCPACGYDLHGLASEPACPECGRGNAAP